MLELKLRANSSDTLTNPDLCFENVAQFKRFLNKINYKEPIAVMSDNTKFKYSLRYSSRLGCIIGSILSNEKTKIQEYNDISRIINSIKDKKAIANYVRPKEPKGPKGPKEPKGLKGPKGPKRPKN
ncbi:hypothetical protein Glove_272g28 [Diversispora epigaea]|uniref:Uncharacterized protein n=1 Tax=Diversispora epigaea TaxID=1348612 RepID=A0A397IB23_9GLOM|nr:hypothetical protein Glove_272g28 [Diversispora epigaea]